LRPGQPRRSPPAHKGERSTPPSPPSRRRATPTQTSPRPLPPPPRQPLRCAPVVVRPRALREVKRPQQLPQQARGRVLQRPVLALAAAPARDLRLLGGGAAGPGLRGVRGGVWGFGGRRLGAQRGTTGIEGCLARAPPLGLRCLADPGAPVAPSEPPKTSRRAPARPRFCGLAGRFPSPWWRPRSQRARGSLPGRACRRAPAGRSPGGGDNGNGDLGVWTRQAASMPGGGCRYAPWWPAADCMQHLAAGISQRPAQLPTQSPHAKSKGGRGQGKPTPHLLGAHVGRGPRGQPHPLHEIRRLEAADAQPGLELGPGGGVAQVRAFGLRGRRGDCPAKALRSNGDQASPVEQLVT
jgi:hypothetical protein